MGWQYRWLHDDEDYASIISTHPPSTWFSFMFLTLIVAKWQYLSSEESKNSRDTTLDFEAVLWKCLKTKTNFYSGRNSDSFYKSPQLETAGRGEHCWRTVEWTRDSGVCLSHFLRVPGTISSVQAGTPSIMVTPAATALTRDHRSMLPHHHTPDPDSWTPSKFPPQHPALPSIMRCSTVC